MQHFYGLQNALGLSNMKVHTMQEMTPVSVKGALCNIFTGYKQTNTEFLMQETVVCRSEHDF